MRFTRLRLKNWRNFKEVDLQLGKRLFITGPNASGKSNLLDAFRFLRDIAKEGGGVQEAVRERGGLSKIRCLAARKNPEVVIAVDLASGDEESPTRWFYEIALVQQSRGLRRVLVQREVVRRNGESVLDRPEDVDRQDDLRLTETHLEQISRNQTFRPIAEAFRRILYLHLVPQLLKFPQLAQRDFPGEDPFGVRFLERVMETPEKTRRARLKKIETALKAAVPELQNLTVSKDEMGVPHLEAVYQHWRPDAGRQREDQFSDGTLRLIGLLWTLLEGDDLLLLEEPELSLHSAIVKRLPELIWRMQQARGRQVFVSSHSAEIFSNEGILPENIALLAPQGSEGTHVRLASDIAEIQCLLDEGMSPAEAVLPRTAPDRIVQLSLFD
ncbi:MAG: AAA family ATPase [Verrucomicrobiales bacterium]|nr:AAA family ATPase [Verrucomicrobiales bacterium]